MTGRRSTLLATTAIGLALVLAGCSGGSAQPAAKAGSAATGDEVRLVTSEWKFEPGSLKVPVGKPVTVVLENKGALEHDIHAPGTPLHLLAGARKTEKQSITFDKPGTYEFDCSLPGHKEAGMKGQLVVGS